MDKIGEEPKKETVAIYANKLPAEIVGRFQQNLSVGDRLKTERVSPHWKLALSKWGWTEQKKLDADIVFEGATEEEIEQFWEELDDGSCQLALLIDWCCPWLRELDLGSFGGANFERFLSKIVESIDSLRILENLNICGLRLRDFVDRLPANLRELKTDDEISFQTLKVLSNRCSNLEEVPFEDLENIYLLETEAVIELIGKFPRQKKLDLRSFSLCSKKQGALASFGQLKASKQIDLWNCECLDGESLGAIVGGCQRLRSFTFHTQKLTERELFQLTRIQNLTVLEICDRKGEFTDAVLKTIAQRGKLKKFIFYGSKTKEPHTDNSIVYLVDQCKSLVHLDLFDCPGITERSVEAVVTEVQGRHGWPPRTLPTDEEDPGIFHFGISESGIDEERVEQLIDGYSWMKFNVLDPRQII